MELHERIKLLRESRYLSQRAFSDFIGGAISHSTIAQIERGQTEAPRADTIRIVADGLGLAPEELLRGLELTQAQKMRYVSAGIIDA